MQDLAASSFSLIAAHQFMGDPTALAVLNKATDVVLPWLLAKALNREEMTARPHKISRSPGTKPTRCPKTFISAISVAWALATAS